MRLISIDELKGNEVTACNVNDVDGRILLTKGSRIKLSYIEKLDSLGIYQLYVEDAISENIRAEGLLCEETKQEAKKAISTEMQKYAKKREFDVAVINKITNIIINEILLNRVDLINLKDIKLKDEYLFSHCINVCSLAVFMGLKLGFSHSKIQNIGTGCILHDFGKLLIPSEILKKTSPLTAQEYVEMKKHPLYGYEALKDDPTIRPTTKVIVYMHHEKVDGSGYPNKLKGDKLHDSVKICSICNKFDSMTSKLPYRKPFSVSYAIEYLYSTAGIFFDKTLVGEFLKYVPIYPSGTIILLNNGIIAIVVKNNTSNLLRPIVRYLYNPKNKIKYKDREVDLMEELTLSIEQEVVFNMAEYNSISYYG